MSRSESWRLYAEEPIDTYTPLGSDWPVLGLAWLVGAAVVWVLGIIASRPRVFALVAPYEPYLYWTIIPTVGVLSIVLNSWLSLRLGWP